MKRSTVKENTYHFGLLLAEILQKKKLKQKKLSELSGLSEPYISQILSEKRTPDLNTLKLLCNAMNIKLSYFLMKSIMEEELPDGLNEEFVNKHIKPTIIELNKLLFEEDYLDVKKENYELSS